MTTYRLSDGTEGTHVRESTDYEEKLWVLHSQLGLILIDRDKLTEVKPPLPPEPPTGTVFSNGADAWIRCDGSEMDPRWWLTGSDVPDRWADHVASLVSTPGWRRYVPDPADDPALVERVAQAMRDANASEAWERPWQVPFDHFAKVAVDTVLAAREVEQEASKP